MKKIQPKKNAEANEWEELEAQARIRRIWVVGCSLFFEFALSDETSPCAQFYEVWLVAVEPWNPVMIQSHLNYIMLQYYVSN